MSRCGITGCLPDDGSGAACAEPSPSRTGSSKRRRTSCAACAALTLFCLPALQPCSSSWGASRFVWSRCETQRPYFKTSHGTRNLLGRNLLGCNSQRTTCVRTQLVLTSLPRLLYFDHTLEAFKGMWHRYCASVDEHGALTCCRHSQAKSPGLLRYESQCATVLFLTCTLYAMQCPIAVLSLLTAHHRCMHFVLWFAAGARVPPHRLRRQCTSMAGQHS